MTNPTVHAIAMRMVLGKIEPDPAADQQLVEDIRALSPADRGDLTDAVVMLAAETFVNHVGGAPQAAALLRSAIAREQL